LPNNITANADYREGNAQKPAVLILHGFMTTYNLNIVQFIANELESHGYTILAPTLSLKINNRQSGASCDAIHTHTMETDVEEVLWWLNWLRSKTNKDIIVIGHSTGSLQLAIALSRSPPSYVKKAILTAPAYLSGKPFPQDIEKKEIALANGLKSKNDISLNKYHLSFCKGNFVAPYNVFLSYKFWTADRLIETIQNIKIDHTIILAGADTRFLPNLYRKLEQTKVKIVTIDGSNHFFSSPHELEFLELISNELE
jgi:esterase/lipase